MRKISQIIAPTPNETNAVPKQPIAPYNGSIVVDGISPGKLYCGVKWFDGENEFDAVKLCDAVNGFDGENTGVGVFGV